MILAQYLITQLTIRSNRATDQAHIKTARWQFGDARAAISWTVRCWNVQDLTNVWNILQFPTRKPHVTLGRNRLARIGKLLIPLQRVVEETEHLLIIVKRDDPLEHFTRGVNHTDSLWQRSGSPDFSIEGPLVTSGGTIHHCRFQRNCDKVLLHSADHLGL